MGRFSKRAAVLLGSAIMFIGAAIVSSDIAVAAKVKVSGVAINEPYAKSVTIAKGKKVKITPTVTVKPDKKAYKKLTYKSLDTKIAKVTKKGAISGIGLGSTSVVVSSVKDNTKSVTIKVKVVKNAVSKITLNKKKASVKPGDKLKLNANVKPAKAGNKKLIWTSSDEKTATVDNKGNVTAVAAGNAVIKAAATDGSGVTAKCTLTVMAVADLIDVKVMNGNTLDLTLSKAEAVKVEDIKVYSKKTYEGRFATEHEAKIVQSDDQIHYRLTLGKTENVSENSYVKVVVNSLSGKKEHAVKVNYPNMNIPLPEVVITSTTDAKETMTYIDFSGKIDGEATYTVEGLPAGYNTITKNGSIYVYGKSATVLDNVIAKISAEDEFGNKAVIDVRFLVGNASTIIHYIEPVTVIAGKTGKYYSRVYISGGSDKCTYDIINADDISIKNPGIKITKYSDEYIEFGIDYIENTSTGKRAPADFAPGNYSFGVSIADENNTSIKKDASLSVVSKQPVTLSGYLKDAAGQPIANQMVYAFCTSRNIYNAYSIGGFYGNNRLESNTETDSSGKFTIDVFEGEEYTLSGCGAYEWNIKSQAESAIVNLISPYYKVNIEFAVDNAAKVFTSVRNYDVNSDVLHEYTYSQLTDTDDHFSDNVYDIVNGVGYFLPGKYHLISENTVSGALNAYSANGTWMGKYIADVSFTVENADISVKAAMTKTNYSE